MAFLNFFAAAVYIYATRQSFTESWFKQEENAMKRYRYFIQSHRVDKKFRDTAWYSAMNIHCNGSA